MLKKTMFKPEIKIFLLISFFSFTQELPEDLVRELNLSPEAQRLLDSTQDQAFESNSNGMIEETLVSSASVEDNAADVSEKKKFGYDYFSKIPTNVVAAADIPIPNDYKITLNDEIAILLTGSISRNYFLRVLSDGSILVPEVGNIFVFSDTLQQAREKITSYITSYYVGVNVSVSLGELSAKRINIVGAAKVPGAYLVNPFSSISSALAYAGGIEEYGSLRKIKLIKQSGETISFDLYDILLRGDRSNDQIIEAGDTILIEGTDSFVDVDGNVIRPGIYESVEDESLADLIDLALGPKNNSNLSSIYVRQSDSSIAAKEYDISTKDTMEFVDKVYVYPQAQQRQNNLMIFGPVLNIEEVDYSDNNYFELVSKLKFSNEIYPFIAYLEVNDFDSGYRRKIFFSPEKYDHLKEVSFGNDDAIVFFTSETLENDFFTSDSKLDDFNKLIDDYNLSLNIGDRILEVPVFGNFKLDRILKYLGVDRTNLDLQNIIYVKRITNEKTIGELSSIEIEQTTNHSVSIPLEKTDRVVVTITGAVKKPGTYEFDGLTSVNELLNLAEIESYAAEKSIILQRESIAKLQEDAIKKAKEELSQSLTVNMTNFTSEEMTQLNNLLQANITTENLGRLSGDFSLNSLNSINTILLNNDVITVPRKVNSVNVLGEVAYSNTIIFSEGKTLKYYLEKAGGLTKSADKRGIYIYKSNGETIPINLGIFGFSRSNSVIIEPGDTIIIPRNYFTSADRVIPLIESVTSILSNLAFATASINVLRN